MYKNKLIILISLLLFGAEAQAQLSLNQAIEISLRKNNSVMASQKMLEAKKENISTAWGNYAPTITFEASYTHINDEIAIDLNPIRSAMVQLHTADNVSLANLESVLKTGNPFTPQQQQAAAGAIQSKLEKSLPAFKEVVKEQNFPSGKFTLKQPIFTGGKILAGINAAESLYDVTKIKMQNETDKTITEVTSSYFNVLLAQENLKVRNDVYEGILQHQQRAEKVYREGIIANNDKLRADVALAEAERNLKEAQDKLQLARIALASILDTNYQAIGELSYKLEYREKGISLENSITEAKQNNAALMQLRYSILALKQKLNAKNAEYYPTIYGFGFYNVFKHYLSALDPEWGVGVGLNYELFSGFKTKNESQSINAELQSLELTTKDIERKIELLVRSQYLNMELSKDSYQKLDKTKIQAEENVRLNTKRFEEGLGTSFDALDARLALEGVLLKRISYLNDYYQNLSNLYLTTGKSSKYYELWNN